MRYGGRIAKGVLAIQLAEGAGMGTLFGQSQLPADAGTTSPSRDREAR